MFKLEYLVSDKNYYFVHLFSTSCQLLSIVHILKPKKGGKPKDKAQMTLFFRPLLIIPLIYIIM